MCHIISKNTCYDVSLKDSSEVESGDNVDVMAGYDFNTMQPIQNRIDQLSQAVNPWLSQRKYIAARILTSRLAPSQLQPPLPQVPSSNASVGPLQAVAEAHDHVPDNHEYTEDVGGSEEKNDDQDNDEEHGPVDVESSGDDESDICGGDKADKDVQTLNLHDEYDRKVDDNQSDNS